MHIFVIASNCQLWTTFIAIFMTRLTTDIREELVTHDKWIGDG